MTNEEMVKKAEEMVQQLRGVSDGDEGKSQLSRAQDVAYESPGVRVFVNWLNYQRARSASKSFWALDCDKTNIGDHVVKFALDLDKQGELSQEEKSRCLARFLGYLKRAFVAREYLTK